MTVIAIHNEKGGVGKTTTTINFGFGLARRGKKVLLVDLDYQGNLSKDLLADYSDATTEAAGIIDVANGKADYDDVITPIAKNLSLIAATESLTELSKQIYVFDFSSLNFDYILIDCPPTLGGASMSALKSSDKVIIPAECDKHSYDGVISDVATAKNLGIEIAGVLITRYLPRLTISKVILSDLIAEGAEKGFKVYNTCIRATVAVQESHVVQKNIYDYDANCTAAEDYKKFTSEFLKGEK